jgi:O-antigen/teichoic acid export membrane protein
LTLVLPISVFLFVSGEDLLRVTTAERWLAAAPALRVLCWAGVLRALTRLFDNFFFALSRPALALLDAALSLLVLGTALPLLLHFAGDTLGILAAAYAWLLTYPIVFGVLFVLARRMTPLRFTDYSRELAPVLFGASVMGLCLATINASVSEADVWLRLFLTAGVGLGSYALALRLLRSVRMGDLR